MTMSPAARPGSRVVPTRVWDDEVRPHLGQVRASYPRGPEIRSQLVLFVRISDARPTTK